MNFHEKELVSIHLESLTVLEKIESDKQYIELLLHPALGKILIINGEIHHIEFYQEFYHEQLIHLPISLIENVETALIIGGGSLFAAYEILKYPSVKSVVLCDYDKAVLELMRKHYDHAKHVLSDPRFLHIEKDAHEFIKVHQNKYDLVVNDCFDLALESKKHETSYYKLLSNLIKANGVCSDVIYRHIFDNQTNLDSISLLKKEKNYKIALITIPEYPGIFHLQTIWGTFTSSDNCELPKNLIQLDYLKRKEESVISFNLYDPHFLNFYFFVPPYIRKLFNEI